LSGWQALPWMTSSLPPVQPARLPPSVDDGTGLIVLN
jgi:hypothetical protein